MPYQATCGCERGNQCTQTTVCHVQSVVSDLEEEHERFKEDVEDVLSSVEIYLGALDFGGPPVTRASLKSLRSAFERYEQIYKEG